MVQHVFTICLFSSASLLGNPTIVAPSTRSLMIVEEGVCPEKGNLPAYRIDWRNAEFSGAVDRRTNIRGCRVVKRNSSFYKVEFVSEPTVMNEAKCMCVGCHRL